jgi:hypothetical protein
MTLYPTFVQAYLASASIGGVCVRLRVPLQVICAQLQVHMSVRD